MYAPGLKRMFRAEHPEIFQMNRIYLVAFAAALVAFLPSGSPAQTAPDAPAAASPKAQDPAPTDSPSEAARPRRKAAAARPRKKSLPKAMTQDEINHSIESGTVPSRYRSQVPKDYQQYVPFEKQ
jgi:hypothetical protein